MKYIALWLEGTMQAWGSNSKNAVRGTNNFPTRSGIMGLLLCAMGKGGEQRELLEKLARGSMTVYTYEDKDGIEKMEDYHLVGAGYNQKDKWEKLNIPRRRDGAIPGTGGAKITIRHYLTNARFGVVLGVEDDLCEEIGSSLDCPVWPVFLGRKCCVPTERINQGCFDSADEAHAALIGLANSKNLSETHSVIEGEHEELGEVIFMNDVPVAFGLEKVYRERVVTVC